VAEEEALEAGGITKRLFRMVLEQYRLSANGIHGVAHWGRVLENGRRLARLTGADPRVVELFAIFHDACRATDGADSQHGPRAAALARGWRRWIDLDDSGFALLFEACDCHTRGPRRGTDVTVLTCLDADRLDIPRVGRRIKPGLLFTSAARDPLMISWAGGRGARRETPPVCVEEWGWRQP
jgi:uncharacterized protein